LLACRWRADLDPPVPGRLVSRFKIKIKINIKSFLCPSGSESLSLACLPLEGGS